MGISFADAQKSAATPPKKSPSSAADEQTKETQEEQKTVQQETEEQLTPDSRSKDDKEPTMKEARIISKVAPKLPPERKKAKTKEKPEPQKQDAVGQLIQQKTKEQQDLDRTNFEKKKPF